MSIHADENSNSESGDGVHLRMRKPQVEQRETEKRPPSPTDGSSADDDANVILLQQIALVKVRNQAQLLRKKMDDQLTCLMEEFISEVESVRMPHKYRTFLGEDSNIQKSKKKKRLPCGSLPEKEFLPRNSLLTDLFEINHIQTIYHIFIAILILLFFNTVVEDIVDRGVIDLDFQLIQWAFGGLSTAFITWVGMMFSSLLVVYPAYHLWSHRRLAIQNLSTRLIWDYFWLASYICYIGVAIYVPVRETVVHKLPPASAVALLLEQVRILMKTHAFVRSNIPVTLAYKPKEGAQEEDGPCPDFTKFLYFSFAPTLVYRNRYPRTTTIRWGWVFWNFLQVLGVLFYLYFIFARFCVPVFRQIGHEPMSGKGLVLAVFGCMLPGTLVLLCGFYLLLHSWLNAFAEMLRFADRMFYQDWWNSSTYASYYRTWNVVVHDWLYTYVYKDVYELCGRRNRVLPMLVVFVISSVFHEYVITFTFRCFYPILLLMFGGFGMLFAFVTNVERRLGNIGMWLSLFIGTGLFMSLYSMEWYARINCPPSDDGFRDLLVPRSWSCLTIDGN